MTSRTAAVALAGLLVLGACGGEGRTEEGSPARSEDAAPADPVTGTDAAGAGTDGTSTTTTTAPAPPPAAAGVVAPATDPSSLAARIVATESLTRDPATTGTALDAAAFEQQLRYRQLADRPDWDAVVLAEVPDGLRPVVEAHLRARREFRAMHTTLSDTLPAWRIVEPEPAEVLVGLYREAEAAFGVPWEVLAAVNLVETGLGRIRGTSVAGAQGPMQFMPATWEAFGAGGDVQDTRDAIMGAARYLAHNGGGEGRVDDALWNYNHSGHYVAGVQAYASVIAADPAAFRALHRWQVVYLSAAGELWLPTGYEQTERIPAADFAAAHPDLVVTPAR